ncbi:MAG: pseudoazurin [Pseudomonadota bacterium]
MSIPISARAQSEGKIHIVNMWTDSSFKYYAPDYLRVKVGDTVRFVNKTGSHNTQSIKGMVPEGVPAWNSKLKETFDLKITKEGVYGYKCTPHYAMGMVGVIIAGDPNVNLTKARTVNTPKKAKALFDEFFSKIERGR